jgi:hypothetical protein
LDTVEKDHRPLGSGVLYEFFARQMKGRYGRTVYSNPARISPIELMKVVHHIQKSSKLKELRGRSGQCRDPLIEEAKILSL